MFTQQQPGFAPIHDFDLLQHLANNDLDVLVVNFHALEPVNVLDFIHQILGQRFDAHDLQNVMGHWIAVQQGLTPMDEITFAHRNMLALGDQRFHRLQGLVLWPHDDPPFGLVILTKFDDAIDLGNDCVVFRLAGFKQLRHSRQTAGDVAGLGGFPGNARQRVAGVDHGTVGNRQHRVHGQKIARFEAIF